MNIEAELERIDNQLKKEREYCVSFEKMWEGHPDGIARGARDRIDILNAERRKLLENNQPDEVA